MADSKDKKQNIEEMKAGDSRLHVLTVHTYDRYYSLRCTCGYEANSYTDLDEHIVAVVGTED